MEDKELVRLLKKIVDEKLLGSDELNNAKMCIDILTNGSLSDIKNVRMMAIHVIKRAGLMKLNNTPNRFDVEEDDNKLLAKIPEIIEEIKFFLETKDLDKDLATCLEFVIEDLTDEQKSKEEKLEVIQKYYRVYKPAIMAANEYIPNSSKHGK